MIINTLLIKVVAMLDNQVYVANNSEVVLIMISSQHRLANSVEYRWCKINWPSILTQTL